MWKPFKSRFRVQQIGEFYGATEGTTALFNVGDVDFSVGYMVSTDASWAVFGRPLIITSPEPHCEPSSAHGPGQV